MHTVTAISNLLILYVTTNINLHSEMTAQTHPFNDSLSGTTRVSQYQKGRTNLDFTEARDSEWQRHQLGHMQVCTSLQTDNHASTPPLSFYRLDALPATQPTASKHWRQHSENDSMQTKLMVIPKWPNVFKICNQQLLVDKSAQVWWPEQIDGVQVRQVHSPTTISTTRYISLSLRSNKNLAGAKITDCDGAK